MSELLTVSGGEAAQQKVSRLRQLYSAQHVPSVDILQQPQVRRQISASQHRWRTEWASQTGRLHQFEGTIVSQAYRLRSAQHLPSVDILQQPQVWAQKFQHCNSRRCCVQLD